MTSSFRIALAEATDDNMNAILYLIRQASGWLKDMGTDQWQREWPNVEGRNARVWRGLEVGATRIVWAGDRRGRHGHRRAKSQHGRLAKRELHLGRPAVYAHRLIIDRRFAGFGLGAQLIDWAGLHGRDKWEAEWIRIDVWSTNKGLHEYYMNTGFEPCGMAPDPDYPSGMLFQKSVRKISEPVSPLFTERKAAPDPFGADASSLAHLDLDLYPPLGEGDGSLVSCSIPDVTGQLVLSGAGGPIDPVGA